METIYQKRGKYCSNTERQGCFAFVDFANQKNAQQAISRLNGSVYEGHRIIVRSSLLSGPLFMKIITTTATFAEQTARLSSYSIVIPQIVERRERRQADHFHDSKQDHCYYHGHVEKVEDSLVMLSTCSGLRGLIFIGEKSYGIDPVAESSTNEHLLYQLEHAQNQPFVCGVSNDTWQEENTETHQYQHSVDSMTRLFRQKREALPQTHYVELVLVVDNLRYLIKKSNETAVKEEVVELANLINGYYKMINIQVILTGLEIWKDSNPIDVNGSAGQVVSRFVSWREAVLLPRKRHDAGHLIIGRGAYDGVLGMAFVGSVCSNRTGGGINTFDYDSLQYFSTVVAHELGHNLGMNHDNTKCSCNTACIMDAAAKGGTMFSSCSENDFQNLIFQGGGRCLMNPPSPDKIFTLPVCGNNVVDSGEQCDCGPPEKCNNKCCNAATCMFSSGSSCAEGSCCDNCKIKVAGTPCRASSDYCDLPEYCTGNTGFCPGDFFIMNGYPCANNTAYCFDGLCQSFDAQCRKLFGKTASKAPDMCFITANMRGDRFGNCGPSDTNYIKCTRENVMCGKLQCIGVDTNNLPFGATVTLKETGGVTCVNADFDLGTDVTDAGYVKRGSGCEKGKACMNFQCANATGLGFNCDIQNKCNGNGICNNNGNCHCDESWAPPSCSSRGYGGSIDSGPPHIDTSLRDGLLVFFLLVVPVVAAIIFIVVKREMVFRRCRKSKSTQYRSVYPLTSNHIQQTDAQKT
ncbi:Disintegrin and metalloproteinase domain-containing protein 9 [Acipenser ruthenus]|uniref:Disintegrin and metalloproteinase domain-containing protein 9 n=1 Tax=Acipenser ruthenus TaxID=7906 RepID=A0A444U725_ACIRT|nr:Disintegrin and metalloproteinase domain-containing protein 9 [Acipenser ruthenus]